MPSPEANPLPPMHAQSVEKSKTKAMDMSDPQIRPQPGSRMYREEQSTSLPSRPEIQPSSSPLLPAPSLASGRYNRQMLVPQIRLRGQEFLLASKVLIVGLGGLGSPAALYLAGAGIGTLGLMDGDNVEISNLHRQIVHTESAARLGQSKVQSAAARCRELNTDITYVCHEESASASNVLDIAAQYDLVLDCTDNPATRYLISDACVVLRKVLVSGAAQRGEGTLIVLNSPPTSSEGDEKGPCYRCVFPRPPAPETVRGCSEVGILGPVVGMVGTLMAGEAIKIITSGGHLCRQDTAGERLDNTGSSVETSGQKKIHTMLLYDTYTADPRNMFRTLRLRGRRKDCVACGDDEALATKGLSKITAEVISAGRLDYQAFCGVFEGHKLLDMKYRVHARDFLREHAKVGAQQDQRGKRNSRPIVVDVREEHEYELGPKVRDSLNIPLSKILRQGSDAFAVLEAGPELSPSNVVGPDGGMIDQESHVPVARRHDSYPGKPIGQSDEIPPSPARELADDAGFINQESHIPVTRRHDSYPGKPIGQSDEIPPSPARETDDDTGENLQFPPVYFVCQRGNDSQLAASKLIEKVDAEAAAGQEAIRKKKWGWIGDIQGGLLALERHARTIL
ncbi:molybdopterin biosynthesis protein MoeB [Fonsecaea erecta]|uniref:Molybdopterin biosynthesis protein MoeB n=1 Tax=Fonsecaea erecta TaxID=1367422 RepID=A0A178ZSM9_9EURO|nr:molybdopterin biosynthesis protein MoeB [Fonsecaea erecta]OAP62461.1 molybdopterin biosynthesis protein MoeB [Fonsecaea erecta]